MFTTTKETKLMIPNNGNLSLHMMFLFLRSGSSVHGVPLEAFELMAVGEPVFQNMKMTHNVGIRAGNSKTNQWECFLNIEIPMT